MYRYFIIGVILCQPCGENTAGYVLFRGDARYDLGRGRGGELPPHPALRGHLPPKGEGLESIKKPATGYGSGMNIKC